MKCTVIGYWGGFPGPKEATSGYLFQHENFNVLVDCGSGVLAQLQTFLKIEDLDAVIVSHYHHDHVADIGPLQFARLVKSMLGAELSTLPVYGHTLDQTGFAGLSYKTYTKGVAYNTASPLEIGPFTIDFIETRHPVPCFAMRFAAGGQTVVYTADSSYVPEFIDFTMGADLLVSECNLYADQDGNEIGHMNSADAAAIAEQAGVPCLLLSHLPHFGNHQNLKQQAASDFSGHIDLASIGWTWGNE